MKSRHMTFCTPSHGCEECRAASRACLLYPLMWARDELRTWGTKEKLAAVYCVVAVLVVWVGR